MHRVTQICTIYAVQVQAVRDDIVEQLGQPDGTLLSWRSCERQQGPPTPPSGLPSSSCNRDDPHAPYQRSFDLGFVPDHALAVKLGVIPPHILLQMMPQIRHRSGHRLATKPFEEQYMGGLIMVPPPEHNYPDRNSELTEIYLTVFHLHHFTYHITKG
jgi:hypothetical protein